MNHSMTCSTDTYHLDRSSNRQLATAQSNKEKKNQIQKKKGPKQKEITIDRASTKIELTKEKKKKLSTTSR